MKGFRWAFLFIAVLNVGAANLSAGDAVSPRYLILPPASGVGYLVPSGAPRYAYGWFGVPPRKTATRHFGYYRNYTQWKVK
jgi:hypothetical protein